MIAIALFTGGAAQTYVWRTVSDLQGSFASTGTATQQKAALGQSLLAAGVAGTDLVIRAGNGEDALSDLIPNLQFQLPQWRP